MSDDDVVEGEPSERDAPAPRRLTPRPEPLFELFAPIETVSGVGPKTKPLFEKLAGPYLRDLLFHAPTGVVRRQRVETVQGAPLGESVIVEVEIGRHHPPKGLPRKGASRPTKIDVRDAHADFQLVYFHGYSETLKRALPTGERRMVSGKLDLFDGLAQIVHPDYICPLDEAETIPLAERVYPLTAGLTTKALGRAVDAALEAAPDLPEWLDPAIMAREGWPSWRAAIAALHAPETAADLEPTAPARRRLAYDELLAQQLALSLARSAAHARAGAPTAGDGRLRARLIETLPFALTGAQTRTLGEIEADLARPERMMRLLQGDVGAGKTLVAFLAMLIAVEAGGQAALMAPTDILSRQHAAALTPYAEALGLSLVLLTGRDKGRARAEKLAALAGAADLAGAPADLVIGTHALIQEDVAYRDLRLAVIDEQHRFGVAQRMALAEKGRAGATHMLLMSATPIPRTLALAHYGDMDLSILDEKPPGRQPVDTRLFSLERLDDVAAALGRALEKGARAYWVCPLVDDSELVDLAAAEARARALAAKFGADAVALTHGRMKPEEKDAAMARFVSGAARILVATTVIEVGVNVPEATVMVVEHAERFGLSQLHQLRGRVGRGADASHCLLLYGEPLTAGARARLTALRESDDGFRLAEEDLRLRGAGDLIGLKQSGLPRFRLADLEATPSLMALARDEARLILAKDPNLASGRGDALTLLLHLMDRDDATSLLASG